MARDHAKMMRNAIPDLDEPVRMADESAKIHGIDDFVEKLNTTVIKIAEKTATVSVLNTFQGNISNRCLETSAIDRIVYNYLNNAARFTSDNTIQVTIFQLNDQLVRWVVENPISEDHNAWLNEHVGTDLNVLFTAGITRGGSGIGLKNCAEFVGQSFGINNIQETVQKGYLGAKCIQNRFYNWFHWPIYLPQSNDEQHCTCKPE